tara:strand:+ start:6659 stop:7576 length:918 start_codon:yes stop_codon:yes gene_type:complete
MQGPVIEMHINSFLQRLQKGEAELPQKLIDKCSASINKWFTTMNERSNHGEFTLRLSNIGKPVCQLYHEKKGTQKEPVDAELIPVRFATGALVEAWLFMIIKASGLNVEGSNVPVTLDVSGSQIGGELDIIIDGVIYDIKTTSTSSFYKFEQGFEAVVADDPFGYVVQGYSYAKARGLPFGGWIVLNKSSGKIIVCETPRDNGKAEKAALKQAAATVKKINTDAPYERAFAPLDETFKKQPTGNKKLCRTCGYCEFKVACWPDMTPHRAALSEAKNPAWEYYTELNFVAVQDLEINTWHVQEYSG